MQYSIGQNNWENKGIPSKQYLVDGEDNHLFHINTENNIFREKQLFEFDRLKYSENDLRTRCVSLISESVFEWTIEIHFRYRFEFW